MYFVIVTTYNDAPTRLQFGCEEGFLQMYLALRDEPYFIGTYETHKEIRRTDDETARVFELIDKVMKTYATH